MPGGNPMGAPGGLKPGGTPGIPGIPGGANGIPLPMPGGIAPTRVGELETPRRMSIV